MAADLAALIAHLVWADDRILAALDREPRAAADAELLRTLGHIAACEHLWLARMRGEPARVAVWPALDIDECAALFGEAHAELGAVAATLSSDSLERSVSYVNSAGESWSNTVDQILTHIAMHGQYHRGQIVRAIRRAGGIPPTTDFIVWARTGGT